MCSPERVCTVLSSKWEQNQAFIYRFTRLLAGIGERGLGLRQDLLPRRHAHVRPERLQHEVEPRHLRPAPGD